MVIEKGPNNPVSAVFQWQYFSSARQGLKRILECPALRSKKILLPAYIGYSIREGSGVFDPINELKKEYGFYRLKRDLTIDESSLEKKMADFGGQILLLIHYFGFKDKNIDSIKRRAWAKGMIIIEDFAHAFYTFYSNPEDDFDYAIFSLHKMFPEADGGLVLSRDPVESMKKASDYDLFRYNLPLIVEKRRENYVHILQALNAQKSDDRVVLFPILGSVVPQSFPVLLKDKETRDNLYFRMNEMGYGVVSLYHKLIGQLDGAYDREHEISDRILNLPVHQDVNPEQLEGMMQALFFLSRVDSSKGKV